jgi:hypothetical protein
VQSISEQLSTGKKFNPIDNCNTTVNCRDEVDLMFTELHDLVNEKFKPWYCKQFYRLGRKEVEKRASQARNDGFNKQKLFSKLLKGL